MSFSAGTGEGYSHDTEPPQPPRQKRQQSPPMRLSCDECALAKVRCSKTHPVCVRCTNSCLECVYGLSMKHGRGAGKRRKAAAAQTQSRSVSSTNLDSQNASAGIIEASQSSYASMFGGPAAVAPMLSTIPPQSINSSALPSLPDPFSRTPSSDGNVTTDLPDDFLIAYQAPFESVQGLSEQVSTDVQFDVVHDCYELAHSTMALLSFNPTSRSLESLAVEGTQGNSQNAVLNLVDVLQGIKKAFTNINELIQCWCLYGDSRMVLLYGSIIMRILYWHRVASGHTPSYISLSSPSRDSALSSADTRLGQLVPITSEPVTIGKFVPDAEEQDTIRRTHLMRNLKKLEDVIERFSSIGEMHRTIALSLRSELAQAMNER